jgi:DNA repair exonuclease SbcCD nuclease subunit
MEIFTCLYSLRDLYQGILLFITEYIGDDVYKDYTTGRKSSSENPFVYEVFQSQTTRKLNKKKCNKKQSKKNRMQKLSDAQADVVTEKSISELKEDAKTLKQKKIEMDAIIKELLPKDPQKRTISLDDEPEFHIIEVNGEYRKVNLEDVKKHEIKFESLSEKHKQK